MPDPYFIKHMLSRNEAETIWHHFADNIFINIFLNENFRILTKISLKYVLCGLINNM